MGIQEQKHDIRQMLLQLAGMKWAVTTTVSDALEQSFILERIFNTVDITCSILQGWTEIDMESTIQKSEQESAAAVERLGHEPKTQQVLLLIEREIKNLLENGALLNESYAQEPETPTDTGSPSLQHLSETVYTANGQLEAESIRLFLNAFGIPVRIAQESAGVALGLTVGSLGEADIRVAPEDDVDAVALLQAMQEGVFVYPEDPDEGEEA